MRRDRQPTGTPRLDGQLDSLNDEQRRAAIAPPGPVLVLAGAGAGKTRLIVARIVALVDGAGADPGRILAITFAKKTAQEMQARLAVALGGSTARPTVSTMHAAALGMLRRHPQIAGLRPGFKVVDQAWTRRLVTDLLPADTEASDELIKSVVTALTRLKDAGLVPEQEAIARWSQECPDAGPAEAAALALYAPYQAHLRDANEADFADLMLWPTLAMEADVSIRRTLAGAFDHILVDEYQDTSAVQNRWLTALALEHRSICCVADDDQTIYAWRGAEVDNVLDFETRWPGAAVLRLSTNYRSTPTIVAASDALIGHNRRRLVKQRRSTATDAGEPVAVLTAPTIELEAAWHADALAVYLQDDHRRTAFLLYRGNFQSRAIEEALIERNLAFAVVGDVGFYRRREVLDATAYACLMEDPRDTAAFARIGNLPARGLGDRTRARIVEASAECDGDLLAAAQALLDAGGLDRRAVAGAGTLLELRRQWQDGATDGARLGDRLHTLLAAAGYLDMLFADPDGRGDERGRNVEELARVATVAGSVAKLLERSIRGAAAVDDSARLTLMTIHASKGLEADAVHLVGWQEGVLPSRHALEREARGDSAAIEEERRLAYVALTRARHAVTISHCREGGQARSRFITEIPARLRRECRPAGTADRPNPPASPRPGRTHAPSEGDAPGRIFETGEAELLPVDGGHKAVAEALLSAVDRAVAAGDDTSWSMPWHDVSDRPSNPVTGQKFSGSNVLTLWAAATRRGLVGRGGPEAPGAHYWASRKSWRGIGGQVVPSAEPQEILMPVYDQNRSRQHVRGRDRPIGADAEDRTVPVLLGFRRWVVFNGVDVAGAKLPERGPRGRVDVIADAEVVVGAYLADAGPALVHGGAAAVYLQRYDRIAMPAREAFARDGDAVAYYATLLHELAHSTGSRTRLDRPELRSYDRDPESRAAEELVAEFAAAMIGAAVGFSTSLRADHVRYVRSWRSLLADRPERIMRAIADAECATRFILETGYRTSRRNRAGPLIG